MIPLTFYPLRARRPGGCRRGQAAPWQVDRKVPTMDLRLVTVALDPEAGCFPGQPLQHLNGEVVNVVEQRSLRGDGCRAVFDDCVGVLVDGA